MEGSSSRRRMGKSLGFSDVVQESSGSGNSYSGSGVTKVCFCDLSCPLQTSWTTRNLGRRFSSCPRYKDEGRCTFFKWVDPAMSDHAREVILNLRDQLHQSMHSSSKPLISAKDMDEQQSLLENEINLARGELVYLKKAWKSEKREKTVLGCCLILSWFIFLVIGVCIAVGILDYKSKENVGTHLGQLQ